MAQPWGLVIILLMKKCQRPVSREDRLVPILNLVVYWGTKPWDGPLRLHEILDIKSDLVEYRDKIPSLTV